MLRKNLIIKSVFTLSFIDFGVDTDFENNINGRVKKFPLPISRDTQHDRRLIFCFPAVCSKTTREGISVVGSHSIAIVHMESVFMSVR